MTEQQCACVRCIDCNGLGYIVDPFDYSGLPNERCFDCDGSGLSEECDYCREIMEEVDWI